VTIVLNGRKCELPEPGDLEAVFAELGLTGERRGVAVAIDGEVVPRAEWGSRELDEGARVEVLTAMQGG
jgi:sulfur carrier protein